MTATLLSFPPAVTSFPMQPAAPTTDPTSRSDHATDDGELWGSLMAKAQRGDRAAYHALLSGITGHLSSIARHYLSNGNDAEDAVQEILIVINDIRHTYEPDRPFKPWLNTIATRRCIDILRRRTRRLQKEFASDDDFRAHTWGGDTPEEALARQQTRSDVRNTVDTLPERQRDAIRMVHLDELSLAEAAERSEQSSGSIKVACHRALKALESKLRTKK